VIFFTSAAFISPPKRIQIIIAIFN
jgi:hypothetical protein